MFHNYGYEVSIILKNAERERFSLKHPYVGTEHLLLAILKEDNEVSRMLLSYNFSLILQISYYHSYYIVIYYEL